MQLERTMNDAEGFLRPFAADQHRDFDFAGRDHLDVDARIGQRAEHLLGYTRLLGHAKADDGSSGRSRMRRKSHVRFSEKGVATYWSFDQPPPVNSALGPPLTLPLL